MSERAHGTEHEAPGEWRKLAFLAAVSGVLGLLSLVADQFLGNGSPWALILIAGSCLAGGWDAAIDGWAALTERRIDVHLLMIVVAVGAWIVGAQWEGALLLFLFSTAGAIEHYAMDRTRGAIDALLDKSPKHARRLGPDDSEIEVPVSALLPGDRIAILPGELVPADGKVLSGESAVDESNLTGEAKPASKQAGSDVAGGTLNSWGRLIVEVTRAERDSALQRIVRLIREAQDSKAPAQRAIDKWGDAYAIFTLSASALFFLYLQFTAPDGVREASPLYRAMTLLVVLKKNQNLMLY